MKCYNHPERDAVSTCTKCGKGLCKECTDKYSPILCDECRQEYEIKQEEERLNYEYQRLQQEKANKYDLWFEILLSLVSLGVGFLIAWGLSRLFDGPIEYWVPSSYFLLVLFIPFSWRTVGQIIPSVGCLTFLLRFLVASVLSPLFFLYGVFVNAKGIRKSSSKKGVGVILEIIYILSIILVLAILCMLFLHLRLIHLRQLYPDDSWELYLLLS